MEKVRYETAELIASQYREMYQSRESVGMVCKIISDRFTHFLVISNGLNVGKTYVFSDSDYAYLDKLVQTRRKEVNDWHRQGGMDAIRKRKEGR